MPYQGGSRLPAEHANKIGHIDVVRNPLVEKLNAELEDVDATSAPLDFSSATIPVGAQPLQYVYAADGSYQIVEGTKNRLARRAFVKTALLGLDMPRLSSIDQRAPHPLAMRDLLADAALHHATMFPLKHVVYRKGINTAEWHSDIYAWQQLFRL